MPRSVRPGRASEAAHARYWADSNLLADAKWDRVFGEVVPKAQAHIARIAKLSDPRLVAFAPNTHEFVTRLYSCLAPGRKPRVLTTASEFHSFRRQTRRLQEAGLVEVEEIPTAPWSTFVERFVAAERRGHWDMVWLSHVFFDSAFIASDLDAICEAAPDDALVCIDGYHALCAIPIDLARVHRRAFYLGGGYKYAMAGEGAAYLAIPPGCELRPIDTGWFASFDTLATGPGEAVSYAPNAMRFMADIAPERFGPVAEGFGVLFDPANPKPAALECADRTEHFIAQFDVPKRLKDAGVPRNELNDIVGPIARELQHNSVVDRPVTEDEVLALLESCY